jgi:hypothetical protein
VGKIVAIVTSRKDEVAGGGAPVFAVGRPLDAEKLAFALEKVLDCPVCRVSEHHFVLVDPAPPSPGGR